MNKTQISADIINNLIDVMSIAAKQASHPESGIENLPGSLRYFSGCEFPFYNGVFNTPGTASDNIIRNLNNSTEFFLNKDMPFIWWWTEQTEIPLEIKKTLDENDFKYLGDFFGIAANTNEIYLGNQSDKISTKLVESPTDYDIFIEILATAFEMNGTIKADIAAMNNSYGPSGKFKHYLGSYNGKPVSALTAYRYNNILGLYNGATLPNMQKKGICSSMAQCIMQEFADNGGEYVVSQLMATAMAKGLSEKLGAKSYCILMPFLKTNSINLL